jgi:hypothetical protein
MHGIDVYKNEKQMAKWTQKTEKLKRRFPQRLTSAQRAEIESLDTLPEEKIDTSDIRKCGTGRGHNAGSSIVQG